MIKVFFGNLRDRFFAKSKSADLVFVLFMILILNVSLAVKLCGIILIYLLRPDFRFKLFTNRIPFFYAGMIAVSIVQFVLNYNRGLNYDLLALLALTFWIVSFLVIHQVKLAIEKHGVARVEKAVNYFFILNTVVSAGNLVRIMFEVGDVNPFTFDGMSFKYSASTGDYIKGIMTDISTANMIVNSFGIFYFLYQRKYRLSGMCFIVAMFTTSNLGNVILIFFFVLILFFDSSRLHKSIVICYLGFLVLFIAKISPSNLNYLNYKVKNIFRLKERVIKVRFEDHSEKDKLIDKYVNKYNKKFTIKQTSKKSVDSLIAENNFKAKEKIFEQDTIYVKAQVTLQNHFVEFYKKLYGDTSMTQSQRDYYNKYPGKYISFLETFGFVKSSPGKFLLGSGAGNFSSKLAFKASNLGVSGKYIQKLAYISPEFKNNHLKLALNYYLKPSTEHSIINFPNSVFNQLFGEYGIAGLLLFFITYVWFYLKNFRKLTYGKILLPMCLFFLLTDYWFESFSIVIIFEIMMLIDITKNTSQNSSTQS
jgi:hypothetical protein